MKLTSRSRYGTLMLRDIALHGGDKPVPTRDVSMRNEISQKYLEQLITELRKAGLVVSKLGPNGGYMLARPAEEISVGDIVRALEEDATCQDCCPANPTCSRNGVCLSRTLWSDASKALLKQLDAFSLADLVRDVELCPCTTMD